MTFNADLHTYGWPTFERGKLELPGISYRGERSLKHLVDRCSAVNLSLVGFVNFGDRRFEQLHATTKQLPRSYSASSQHASGTPISISVLTPDGKVIHIIRGQQVLTQNGRVLVLGVKPLADNQPLANTLREAQDLGALIIAPGPYFVQGKNIEDTVPGQAEYTSPLPPSTVEVTFDRFHSFYDAVETFSASPWPRSPLDFFRLKKQNELSARFAQNYDLPKIAVSEAHALSHLGHAFISFPTALDDDEEVLPQLRRRLASQEYGAKKETISPLGIGRLLAADLWNHVRVQAGLLQIRRE